MIPDASAAESTVSLFGRSVVDDSRARVWSNWFSGERFCSSPLPRPQGPSNKSLSNNRFFPFGHHTTADFQLSLAKMNNTKDNLDYSTAVSNQLISESVEEAPNMKKKKARGRRAGKQQKAKDAAAAAAEEKKGVQVAEPAETVSVAASESQPEPAFASRTYLLSNALQDATLSSTPCLPTILLARTLLDYSPEPEANANPIVTVDGIVLSSDMTNSPSPDEFAELVRQSRAKLTTGRKKRKTRRSLVGRSVTKK
jgi:hypothetical protein